MRRLLIIAALSSVLFATSPPVRPVPGRYHCQEDQDEAAVKEAELFINEQHRHGYKFKLSHVDSRTVVKQDRPCLLKLALTLEETKCHVVNPTPLEKCPPRERHEVKVEAKCNVTICGGGDYPGIKDYSCNTHSESNKNMVTFCPDCPLIVPLDDEHALEAVHAAIKKFNKESNHTSYFKLLEVGRTLTYYIPSTGTHLASEFVIVETACSDKATAEDNNCEQKCSHEADHGFCKSRKNTSGLLSVDCTIYNSSTSHSHIQFRHEKHCEKHKDRAGPPFHQNIKGHKDPPAVLPSGPPAIRLDVPVGCYIRLTHPYHPHHHGGHHHHHGHGDHHHGGDHHGHGDHHEGHHDKKQKEHKDHPHGHDHDHGHDQGRGHGRGQGHGHGHGQGHGHGHGHNRDHDHKEPHPTPTGSPSDKFTRTKCPGLTDINPYIHPICSFPRTFRWRGHKSPQGSPAPDAQ